jgi:hypothetical protein
MNRFLLNCLISGGAAGLVSHLVAAACSRVERGRSDLAMHAVSHIAWGDAPEDHRGRHTHNFVIGSALHHGASLFWSVFFEALFGRRAERSTPAALVGGATVAAAAYVTDYHVVSERFKPGFEAHMSNRALFLIYTGLAIGFAAGARLRGLHRHQIENHDEREKRGDAERRPDPVITPE